jgi:hypothetical protein
VELVFRPTVGFIDLLRRFVTEFCRELSLDPDDGSRVALATYELVENAARHSTDGRAAMAIDVAERREGAVLTIRIANRASQRHRESLQARLDELKNLTDAESYYVAMMHRTAKLESGLGLARVCSEAEMEVSGQIVGEEVELYATTRVTRSEVGV